MDDYPLKTIIKLQGGANKSFSILFPLDSIAVNNVRLIWTSIGNYCLYEAQNTRADMLLWFYLKLVILTFTVALVCETNDGTIERLGFY